MLQSFHPEAPTLPPGNSQVHEGGYQKKKKKKKKTRKQKDKTWSTESLDNSVKLFGICVRTEEASTSPHSCEMPISRRIR